MVTGAEILPETAKALSAPFTKLIEVIAAGCGRLHEPRHVRKMAEAQGDSLVIMEEAKARASEIATRAAQRLLDLEVRRQSNLDAIASIAQEQLPPEVSDEPVDSDWSVRFFQTCQDVGNEDMQILWAKLLAGEIAQPGSYSLRTLQVLSHLSRAEARAFEALCAQSPYANDGSPVLLILEVDEETATSIGISRTDFQNLEEAGLLSRADLGKTFTPPDGRPIGFQVGPSEMLVVQNEKGDFEIELLMKGQVPSGVYSLTAAGSQLARLVPCAPSEERIRFLEKMFSVKGLTVKRLKAGPAVVSADPVSSSPKAASPNGD